MLLVRLSPFECVEVVYQHTSVVAQPRQSREQAMMRILLVRLSTTTVGVCVVPFSWEDESSERTGPYWVWSCFGSRRDSAQDRIVDAISSGRLL